MVGVEMHGSIAVQMNGKRTLHHHCVCHKTEEPEPEKEFKTVIIPGPSPEPNVIVKIERIPCECVICRLTKWLKRFF